MPCSNNPTVSRGAHAVCPPSHCALPLTLSFRSSDPPCLGSCTFCLSLGCFCRSSWLVPSYHSSPSAFLSGPVRYTSPRVLKSCQNQGSLCAGREGGSARRPGGPAGHLGSLYRCASLSRMYFLACSPLKFKRTPQPWLQSLPGLLSGPRGRLCPTEHRHSHAPPQLSQPTLCSKAIRPQHLHHYLNILILV